MSGDAGAVRTGTDILIVRATGEFTKRPGGRDHALQPPQQIIDVPIEAFYQASPQRLRSVVEAHPLLNDPRFIETIKANPWEGISARLDAVQQILSKNDISGWPVYASGTLPARKKQWKVTDPLVLIALAAFVVMVVILLLTR